MITLQNDNVSIRYNEKDKEIFFRDLTDVWNDTSAYTLLKRGVPKAWQFIEQLFQTDDLKDGITFAEVRNILTDKFHNRIRTYCGMD